jgi:transcriptional regulator with XRE-family HTH domain
MLIGDRLRALREAKKLSQGDIERNSGLLRCYVSRVENGHTVPAIETLEKWARALRIPLYQLFYEGEALPQIPREIRLLGKSPSRRGPRRLGRRYISEMHEYLTKLDRNDRALILHLTKKIVNTRKNANA